MAPLAPENFFLISVMAFLSTYTFEKLLIIPQILLEKRNKMFLQMKKTKMYTSFFRLSKLVILYLELNLEPYLNSEKMDYDQKFFKLCSS